MWSIRALSHSHFHRERATLLAAVADDAQRLRDRKGMDHLRIQRGARKRKMLRRSLSPQKAVLLFKAVTGMGLRVKRQLVKAADGGVSRSYRAFLAWLRRLRALEYIAIGDMIFVRYW